AAPPLPGWRAPARYANTAGAAGCRRGRRGRAASIRPRARFAYCFRPLGDFLAEEGGELAGRVRLPLEAELRQLLLHIGGGKRAVDLGVEPVHELGGHARGREERGPGEVVEPGEALLVHRRYVGQRRRALRTRHGNRSYTARSHMRHGRWHGG